MVVEVLKQVGTWHISSAVLKMSVNTGDSTDGEPQSGPAALLCGFCLLKILLTSLLRMEIVVLEEGGGPSHCWAVGDRSVPLTET